jgi:hypothetical protein
METTQTPTKAITLAELTATVTALQIAFGELAAKVKTLEESSKSTAKSEKDMTDDHARQILIGDCKDLKHNEAATKLGLSYGQVYSCRGEYTFRHVHKVLKEQGFKNPWKKA